MRFGWVRAATFAAMLMVAACGRSEPAAPAADLAANLASANAFLARNAKADGVKTLPSGVQYKVLKSGPATGVVPDANDLVSVNYEGSLIDGTVFDSSFQRGVPYAAHLDEVVPGWTEALTRMHPGDEWLIYLPPALGYGERGGGTEIPPNSALIFRVQLIDVAPVPGTPRVGAAGQG